MFVKHLPKLRCYMIYLFFRKPVQVPGYLKLSVGFCFIQTGVKTCQKWGTNHGPIKYEYAL